MKDFWTVVRMELLLFQRGRLFWPMLGLMVLLALFFISNLTFAAYGAWLQFCLNALLTSLTLALTVGDQIQRDRAQHFEGVVWSTSVPTSSYVLGKLLATFVIMLGLAAIQLLASLILSALIPSQYPSLGPWPLLYSWPWLVLPALFFGAALTISITTLTQRPFASSIFVILIWLLPVFAGPLAAKPLFIAGWYDEPDTAKVLGYTFGSATPPSRELANEVIRLVQLDVPWAHLTPAFFIGRILFLSLAVILMLATFWTFGRQRRGKAY